MIRDHEYRSDYNGGPCTYKYHLMQCGRPKEEHENRDYKTRREDSNN